MSPYNNLQRQMSPRLQIWGLVRGITYGETLPQVHQVPFHHNGPCTQKCHKCNKIGHLVRDCRSTGNTNVANAQRGNEEAPKGNGCFECGAPWHFKRDCPKRKNKNGGNGNAQAGCMRRETQREEWNDSLGTRTQMLSRGLLCGIVETIVAATVSITL
ncbi:putative reverse transcriptase domain-containing protein [Tanacetum coccineum]